MLVFETKDMQVHVLALQVERYLQCLMAIRRSPFGPKHTLTPVEGRGSTVRKILYTY